MISEILNQRSLFDVGEPIEIVVADPGDPGNHSPPQADEPFVLSAAPRARSIHDRPDSPTQSPPAASAPKPRPAPPLSNRIVRLFTPHRRKLKRLVVSDHIPYLNFEQRTTKQQYRSRRKKLETGRGTGRKPKKYKNKPPELTEEEIERACAEIQARWTPVERAKRKNQIMDPMRFDAPVSLGSH